VRSFIVSHMILVFGMEEKSPDASSLSMFLHFFKSVNARVVLSKKGVSYIFFEGVLILFYFLKEFLLL
jgi:hypothetical protein